MIILDVSLDRLMTLSTKTRAGYFWTETPTYWLLIVPINNIVARTVVLKSGTDKDLSFIANYLSQSQAFRCDNIEGVGDFTVSKIEPEVDVNDDE